MIITIMVVANNFIPYTEQSQGHSSPTCRVQGIEGPCTPSYSRGRDVSDGTIASDNVYNV